MKHVANVLQLDVAECRQLARLLDAAGMLRDIGRHDDADDLARLAVAAGAVVAVAVTDMAAPVADAGRGDGSVLKLVEWAELHEIPETTARRWARAGRLDAVKRRGAWWVVAGEIAS